MVEEKARVVKKTKKVVLKERTHIINPTKGKWINLPGYTTELKIRAFKNTNVINQPNVNQLSEESMEKIFNYSLMDWKKMRNEDGPMEYNKENKQWVYDYDLLVFDFVIKQSSELRVSMFSEEEIKNLKTLQLGDLQVEEK